MSLNTSRIYKYWFVWVFVISLFAFNACKDTIITELPQDSEAKMDIATQLNSEITEMLASIENRFSDETAVRKAEKNFSEISKKFPRFAAFKFDRKVYEETGGLKLKILIQNNDHPSQALEQLRSIVNEKAGGNKLNFNTSDISIENVKYNFRQLQAFRDILFGPILNTEGVSLINLDDSRNRIVIGVKDEGYRSNVESVLSKFPVPKEAVVIEIFNFSQLQSGNNNDTPIKNLMAPPTVQDYVRPLTGGLIIHDWADMASSCTLGLIAKWGGTDVFITNSHCTRNLNGLDPKTSFIQAYLSNIIGDELHDRDLIQRENLDGTFTWGRWSDASIIKLFDMDFEFATVAMPRGFNMYSSDVTIEQLQISPDPERLTYIAEQVSLINLPVAKVGQKTGGTAGYVRQTCVTIAVQDYHLFCQDMADYYSDSGDSGAPVFTFHMGDTNPGEAKLLGIHHIVGYYEALKVSIYSPLEGIRQDFNAPGQPPGSFTFVRLRASIFGNEMITQTGSYNYDSVVTNTTGSVNYQWSIRWEGSSVWNQLGNGSSQNIMVSNDYNFTLKLVVIDDVSTNEIELPVTVITDDCSDPAFPCQN